LSGEKLADARRGGNRGGFGLLPGDGEEDEEEVGAEKDEVAPTGKTEGRTKGDEVDRIGEYGEKEDKTKNKGERAQPGERGSTGAQEESEGENEIPDDVEREDLAEDNRLIGLPARGGVEEEEIERNGEDGELEEVQDAGPIETREVLVRERKEDHENGGGPGEEQNVRGPGGLRDVGDEALVIGTDGLRQGFQREGDAEQEPELTRVAGRAAGHKEGTQGGPENDEEVEGIGDEEAYSSDTDEFKIKNEQNGREESDRDHDSRKLAGSGQGDLTYSE